MGGVNETIKSPVSALAIEGIVIEKLGYSVRQVLYLMLSIRLGEQLF